jgi:hypothetical protein
MKKNGRKNRATHGMKGTGTYSSWQAMKARCQIESATEYHRYGGQGITVCNRWQSFENFLADMGERPEGHSIDRIDSSGNYEPGNCRWADNLTQSNNTSRNVRVEIDGVEKTVSEWSRCQDAVSLATIRRRLKLGLSPFESVFGGRMRSKSYAD